MEFEFIVLTFSTDYTESEVPWGRLNPLLSKVHRLRSKCAANEKTIAKLERLVDNRTRGDFKSHNADVFIRTEASSSRNVES